MRLEVYVHSVWDGCSEADQVAELAAGRTGAAPAYSSPTQRRQLLLKLEGQPALELPLRATSVCLAPRVAAAGGTHAGHVQFEALQLVDACSSWLLHLPSNASPPSLLHVVLTQGARVAAAAAGGVGAGAAGSRGRHAAALLRNRVLGVGTLQLPGLPLWEAMVPSSGNSGSTPGPIQFEALQCCRLACPVSGRQVACMTLTARLLPCRLPSPPLQQQQLEAPPPRKKQCDAVQQADSFRSSPGRTDRQLVRSAAVQACHAQPATALPQQPAPAACFMTPAAPAAPAVAVWGMPCLTSSMQPSGWPAVTVPPAAAAPWPTHPIPMVLASLPVWALQALAALPSATAQAALPQQQQKQPQPPHGATAASPARLQASEQQQQQQSGKNRIPAWHAKDQQVQPPQDLPPAAVGNAAPRLAAIKAKVQQHRPAAAVQMGRDASGGIQLRLRSPLKPAGWQLEHHLRELPPRHRSPARQHEAMARSALPGSYAGGRISSSCLSSTFCCPGCLEPFMQLPPHSPTKRRPQSTGGGIRQQRPGLPACPQCCSQRQEQPGDLHGRPGQATARAVGPCIGVPAGPSAGLEQAAADEAGGRQGAGARDQERLEGLEQLLRQLNLNSGWRRLLMCSLQTDPGEGSGQIDDVAGTGDVSSPGPMLAPAHCNAEPPPRPKAGPAGTQMPGKPPAPTPPLLAAPAPADCISSMAAVAQTPQLVSAADTMQQVITRSQQLVRRKQAATAGMAGRGDVHAQEPAPQLTLPPPGTSIVLPAEAAARVEMAALAAAPQDTMVVAPAALPGVHPAPAEDAEVILGRLECRQLDRNYSVTADSQHPHAASPPESCSYTADWESASEELTS